MKIRSLVVALCLLVAASAFAKGDPNLEPLAGWWKCTGIAFASEMGPEHATKATATGTWIMGGKWLEVVYKEVKTSQNPKPIQAEMLMSYDEALKKIVSGCVDSMGGYCTEESPGWDGDTLALNGNGTMGGQSMKVRDTFTKGDGWIKHMGEIETPKGWMKVSEETCKR